MYQLEHQAISCCIALPAKCQHSGESASAQRLLIAWPTKPGPRGTDEVSAIAVLHRTHSKAWQPTSFREDSTMHQRILCGIGTLLTVALITFSMPDSEASAGWRHRRGGCGGSHGRHHGRMRGWGGGCHGGGYNSGCGVGYAGGGCYAEPVYNGCETTAMQGCTDCGQSGGYGGYDVIEPSCGAPHYQSPNSYAPMAPPQGNQSNQGQPPVPPAPPSGNTTTAPDPASGNAPANPSPPTSPSDSGA